MKENKTCKICGKLFTRRNYMLKHMQNIHSKRYSCPKCRRFFSGPTKHSCAIANGRFLCYVPNCPLKFSNGMAMRLHIRDYHRKMNENDVVNVIKTKKGIREMVQTLCKKINLLNTCFDELKFRVDTISEFLNLKNIGFELESFENTDVTESIEEVVSEGSSEPENEDVYEDVQYIEEEYDDELFDSVPDTTQETTEVIFEESREFSPVLKTDVNIAPPLGLTTSISEQSLFNFVPNRLQSPNISEPERIFLSTTDLNDSLPTLSSDFFDNVDNIVSLPSATAIGSTIVTPLPTNILNFQPSNLNNNSETDEHIMETNHKLSSPAIDAIGNESLTPPPLFFNIEYDSDTNICTTDSHLTFNFDTRPLYEIQE